MLSLCSFHWWCSTKGEKWISSGISPVCVVSVVNSKLNYFYVLCATIKGIWSDAEWIFSSARYLTVFVLATDALKDGAQRFEKKAIKLKRNLWCKNMKVGCSFSDEACFCLWKMNALEANRCFIQFMLILGATVAILILVIACKFLSITFMLPFLGSCEL